MPIYYIIGIILVILIFIYTIIYIILQKRLQKVENAIIGKFLLKVSKIPSFVEVMRDFVADESAFNAITQIHSSSIIHKYESIYVLLENNARIQSEFIFLMKLSMQISELQRHAQFVYIRDFIMNYERDINNYFALYNARASIWNAFIKVKNATIIGFLLPGKKRELI